MKQKDIVLIAVAIFISALLSFFISGKIFGESSKDQKAEEVQAISSEFNTPDNRFFNDKAHDPTQTITIEQSENNAPFRGGN